jgi:RimJ/RimL family protein N-acetyltransferase
MVEIRRATLDDADELARLRWDFRVEHGTPVSSTFEAFAEGFRAFATEALADGAPWRAWVAEDEGRLVGCAWLQLVEKIPHPSRGRWERPIAYAREREAAEAVVWPTPPSASFYRRAGFGSEAAPLGMDLAGD